MCWSWLANSACSSERGTGREERPSASFLNWDDLASDTDKPGYLLGPDAEELLRSTIVDHAYSDKFASAEFLQAPHWGNFSTHQRTACEQLLATPIIKAFKNQIWVDFGLNYDQCLEVNWFDLNRVHHLSIKYFAAFSCPEEDFSDLNGITLGELPQHWSDRARCQTDGIISAAWAYELVRDADFNVDQEDNSNWERQNQRWRMALMNKSGKPCVGRKHEGDFRWQDCQFGLRQQTTGAANHSEGADITMRATYKGVRSIGLGFYLAGVLEGQIAQWQGEVSFGVDQNASRLTPAAPNFHFQFGREAIAGEIYSADGG